MSIEIPQKLRVARRCRLALFAALFGGVWHTAVASDALFIDSSGQVGLGTNVPDTQVHVRDSSGNANIRVENDTGISSLRVMFELLNRGDPLFVFTDTESAESTSFRLLGPNDDFAITHIGTGGADLRLRRNGNLEISGSLSQNSDKTTKTSITNIDGEALLSKLAKLPVARWQYMKAPGIEHLGPMAQDFHSIFSLGGSPKRISPADMAGVSLAAAKALFARFEVQQARIDALESELAEARRAQNVLENLARRIESLEASHSLQVSGLQGE